MQITFTVVIKPGVVGAEWQRHELPCGRVADEHPVGGRRHGNQAVAVRREDGARDALGPRLVEHEFRRRARWWLQRDAVEGDLRGGGLAVVGGGDILAGDGEHGRRWPRTGEIAVAADEGGAGDRGAPRAAHAPAAREGLGREMDQDLGDQQVVRDCGGQDPAALLI